MIIGSFLYGFRKTEEETDTAFEEETDTGESSTGDSGTADTGTEETSSPVEIVRMTGTYTVQIDFQESSSDSDGSLDEIYDCTVTYTLGQGSMDRSDWDDAMEDLNEAYGDGEDCDCSIVVAAVEGVLSSDCLLFGFTDLEGAIVLQGYLAVDQVTNILYEAGVSPGSSWREFKKERSCPNKYETTSTESSFSFECYGGLDESVEAEEIGAWFDVTSNHSIELSW